MRSQSETGGIISVAFDDAHHLHDKVLEQVLHDFVGTSPRDSQQHHLAQIVLAGRPKLKERLFRPLLRPLGSPLLAIECRLPTLNDKEIGEYIEHRLRAADLPVDLFGHDAIQRIAVYSGGNLRHVNAISDRVFQATDASSRKQITAALIETAVKDLDLWQPRWITQKIRRWILCYPRNVNHLVLGSTTTTRRSSGPNISKPCRRQRSGAIACRAIDVEHGFQYC
jgi:hypothetical protein